jgi:hypothetical protein
MADAHDARIGQIILFQGVIAVHQYEIRTVWRLPSTPASQLNRGTPLGADSLKRPVAELSALKAIRTANRSRLRIDASVGFRALFMAWEI